MAGNAPKTPRQRFNEAAIAAASSPTPIIEVGVPMRDGLELAADVYLPVETQLPAPAIVQITPYDKSNPTFFPTEGQFYQSHGYAFVVVDVRGRGKSEGEWRAFVNDPKDGHDIIEWVAQQPWCTGNVGTTGLSYMGWTQWAAASEYPPHLKCMISSSAAGRWQQEIPYTSGRLSALLRLVGASSAPPHRRVLQRGPDRLGRSPAPSATGGDPRFHQPVRRDLARHDGSRHARRLLDEPALRRPLFQDRRSLPTRDRLVRPGRSARRVSSLRAHGARFARAGEPATDRRALESRQHPLPRLQLRRNRLWPCRGARHGSGASALVRLLAEGRQE